LPVRHRSASMDSPLSCAPPWRHHSWQ
jgi:hypothetical protein